MDLISELKNLTPRLTNPKLAEITLFNRNKEKVTIDGEGYIDEHPEGSERGGYVIIWERDGTKCYFSEVSNEWSVITSSETGWSSRWDFKCKNAQININTKDKTIRITDGINNFQFKLIENGSTDLIELGSILTTIPYCDYGDGDDYAVYIDGTCQEV